MIGAGLVRTAVSARYIQAVHTRIEVATLLPCDRYIDLDLVTPRGSNALLQSIQRSTRISVIGHADGLYAVFLDATADEALRWTERCVRVCLCVW